jgi:hypothetical protein
LGPKAQLDKADHGCITYASYLNTCSTCLGSYTSSPSFECPSSEYSTSTGISSIIEYPS